MKTITELQALAARILGGKETLGTLTIPIASLTDAEKAELATILEQAPSWVTEGGGR